MNPLQNHIPQCHLHNYEPFQNQLPEEEDSSLDGLETALSQLNIEESSSEKSIEYSIQQITKYIDIFQKTSDIQTQFKAAQGCWSIIRHFLVTQKSELHRLPPLGRDVVLVCIQEACASTPQTRPQELCLLFEYACALDYDPGQFLSDILQILRKITFITTIPYDDSLSSRTALLHQVFINKALDALILLSPEDLLYLLGASYSVSSWMALNKPSSISQIESVIKNAVTILNIAFPEGSAKAQSYMSLLNVVSVDLGIICAHEYKQFIQQAYEEIVFISLYFKQTLRKFQLSPESVEKFDSLFDGYLSRLKELMKNIDVLLKIESNPQFDISIDLHAKAILSPSFPKNYVECALHAHSIETDLKIPHKKRSKLLAQILTQIFDPRFYLPNGKEIIRNILKTLGTHLEQNEAPSNKTLLKQNNYTHRLFVLFDPIFTCSMRTNNSMEHGNDLLLNLPIPLLAHYCIGSYKNGKNLKKALEVLTYTRRGKEQLATALIEIINSDELSSDLGEDIFPFLGKWTKCLEYKYMMNILNHLSDHDIKGLLEHLLPLSPGDEERKLADTCVISFLSGPLSMLEIAASDEAVQKRLSCESHLLENLQKQYSSLKNMNSIGKEEILPIWLQLQSIELYVLEQTQTTLGKDLNTDQARKELDEYHRHFLDLHEWLLKHPAYQFCSLWHEYKKHIQPTLSTIEKILSKLKDLGTS